MNETIDLIRNYRPGDEASIVALFNEVFGQHRTLERWRWQFDAHPLGSSWITLGTSGDELAGQYCMMRGDLNLRGRRIDAGQSCDTMVRPDQRGKRWFTRLAEANYEYAAGTGMKAVWGFPNSNSYPGFIKYLGWRRITELRLYTLRTGYRKLWGSAPDGLFKRLIGPALGVREARLGRSAGGIEIDSSPTLPQGLEPMLAEIRASQTLSIWKDEAYLRWRYEMHPDFRYRFHTLSRSGEPHCLIVAREGGPRVAVCEMLHRSGDDAEAALALINVARRYAGTDVQRIDFWGSDGGFFDAAFKRCGFRCRPSQSYILCGRVFGDPELEEVFNDPRNWTIVFGDTDVA